MENEVPDESSMCRNLHRYWDDFTLAFEDLYVQQFPSFEKPIFVRVRD
jgi:hypothetical protein